MKNPSTLVGALALCLAATQSLAAGKYCDPPDYMVRAPASLPDTELASLVTRKEKENGASIQELFKKAGPYGHSELGFRYLARAFGYKGDWGDVKKIELWLATREATDRYYRGSSALWDNWVREPETFLKPKREEAEFTSFFAAPAESVEFASCLGTAISRLRCENYIGRAIEPESRVYYGGTTSRSPCAVHYLGGKLSGETPDTAEASSSRKFKDGTGAEITETKSWKWDYKAWTAGSAKSATGLETGTQGAPVGSAK